MKYFVIGDDDTVLGFSLVGVEGITAKTSAEVKDAFNRALSNSNYGIIIITDRCAELIREEVNNFLFTQTFPLILEIQDKNGPITGKPSLKEIVDQAIGIKL
ncbi:MAG: V-type ATP synthase subunit F [Spirochaetaceae bacterium]